MKGGQKILLNIYTKSATLLPQKYPGLIIKIKKDALTIVYGALSLEPNTGMYSTLLRCLYHYHEGLLIQENLEVHLWLAKYPENT